MGVELPALGQVGGIEGQVQLGTMPVDECKGNGPDPDGASGCLVDLLLKQEGAEGGAGVLLEGVLAQIKLPGPREHRTGGPAEQLLKSLLKRGLNGHRQSLRQLGLR
jgi:hypothetical protein